MRLRDELWQPTRRQPRSGAGRPSSTAQPILTCPVRSLPDHVCHEAARCLRVIRRPGRWSRPKTPSMLSFSIGVVSPATCSKSRWISEAGFSIRRPKAKIAPLRPHADHVMFATITRETLPNRLPRSRLRRPPLGSQLKMVSLRRCPLRSTDDWAFERPHILYPLKNAHLRGSTAASPCAAG